MKRNTVYRIFIAAFLIVCIIPLLALPIVGEAKTAANELPVNRPELFESGGLNKDFCSELTDYIAARFAFRQELVTGWSILNAKVFNSSAQEELILGRDGWLFYSETLEDYMGLGLSDGELQSAAGNLGLIQDYIEAQGVDFLFVIAPNKNSLYPEQMPDRIAPNRQSSNAARLDELMDEQEICRTDLFAAFQGQGTLYYAGDSHWNSQGAALAADSILGALGRESGFFSADFSPGERHQGDLFEMLYPALRDKELDMESSESFTYSTAAEHAGGNAMTISTENPEGEGKLLCYRDSFGIALYPYLAQSFETARFSRAAEYDLSAVTSEGIDTVVIELVERNLDYLLRYAPCFPAPERERESAIMGEGLALAERSKENDAGLAKTSGALPEDAWDEGSRIYLRAGDRVYEAWVLKDGESAGFSAWLPTDTAVDSVLCMTGGRLMEYNIEWK